MAGLPRSCELIRLRPDMGSYAGLPQDWGNSVMTYARLALPQMITEPRVLYVDADLLVQADWESLWEMDLGMLSSRRLPTSSPKPWGRNVSIWRNSTWTAQLRIFRRDSW